MGVGVGHVMPSGFAVIMKNSRVMLSGGRKLLRKGVSGAGDGVIPN
jgi:hypothetical protein